MQTNQSLEKQNEELKNWLEQLTARVKKLEDNQFKGQKGVQDQISKLDQHLEKVDNMLTKNMENNNNYIDWVSKSVTTLERDIKIDLSVLEKRLFETQKHATDSNPANISAQVNQQLEQLFKGNEQAKGFIEVVKLLEGNIKKSQETIQKLQNDQEVMQKCFSDELEKFHLQPVLRNANPLYDFNFSAHRFKNSVDVVLLAHSHFVCDVIDIGQNQVVSTGDKSIKFFELSTNRCVSTNQLTDQGRSLLFFNDKFVVVGLLNGFIQCFDSKTFKEIKTLKEHTLEVSKLIQVSKETFASCSFDKKIILWNFEKGVVIRKFEGHQDTIFRGLALFDEKRLVSLSHDKSLKLWDLNSGKCEKTIENIVMEEGQCLLAIQQKKKYVLADTQNILLYTIEGDTEEWRKIASVRAHDDWITDVKILNAFSIVSVGTDNAGKVWNLKNLDIIFSFKGKNSITVVLPISGNKILVGDRDNKITVWN